MSRLTRLSLIYNDGLAEHCQFGLLHDETNRDRIVVGLADQKLLEKLQLDADLTLEKATNSVGQSESVRSQQSIVRGQGFVNQQKWIEFISPNLRSPQGHHRILKGKPTSTR